MEALELARWQFGITTVYHFILVPLTIGLAPLVALMQTFWWRTGKDHWLKLTNFFGKILLINFALGVATGIVQEFQFGMNWSEYSRFVGDIFGAPLAIEALAAFFLESTFLGLWLFGKERLSKGLHLACIWMVAIGVNLSAYWIIAANSWMQHPVGAVYNAETGRAELDGIGGFLEVITNNTAIAAFGHAVAAAFLVAGTLVAGVCGWWIVRTVRGAGSPASGLAHEGDQAEAEARHVWRPGAMVGLITVVISGVAVILTGHHQGQLMYEQQPMKMASAEAVCDGGESVPLSILAIGDLSNDCENAIHLFELPGVTSFMGTNSFAGEESYLPGVNDVQAEYEELYGEGVDYRPNLVVTYWSFRLMIGLGVFSAALAVWGLWALRGGRVTGSRWFSRLCLVSLPMPFLASSFGWIFTEMGRQPWVVHPNPDNPVDQVWLRTADGVSTVVTSTTVLTSLVTFTLLYAALGVVWFWLVRRYVREGIDPAPAPEPDPADDDQPLSFAY
ncbi:cytochrome ubiquinol oxidase subunit I [Georgenia sp. Z1344]|uniref:cytochrome ubiquinol oxidase subunit I n=1 Tax=Georgenia sp. Z1344 TaxID=3416706 RepID=UPI003CED3DE8